MALEDKIQTKEYIFGLDIGTRSVVGLVGFKDNQEFKVIAHCIIHHDTRSMIDGQIHNIEQVTQTVIKVKNELEEQIGFNLKKVCIAAAGRVLKTYDVHIEQTMDPNEVINEDIINALELQAIEKAHRLLNMDLQDETSVYHCVGYTVTKYYLNDYSLTSLIGHKGKKAGIDVLATFLPQEVVDSLYAVVTNAGLRVSSLTLEPIAAINVAIPEQFRLLNIALVDIGAGTSDIAITKQGSIIAYGMIPTAGDEITEQIVHNYLVDFNTAEYIKLKLNRSKAVSFKDIMGISHKIDTEEIFNMLKPSLEKLAESICNKILELNGGKPTNAVFCVGGGGQLNSFTDLLSEKLSLDKTRVALRGSEVLNDVIFSNNSLKSPEMVTPVGICLNGLSNKTSDFIDITVNDEPIKIFDNNNLTLIDVAAYKGFNHKNLICRKGEDLTFYLNGQETKVRGEFGEPAKILVNGEAVSLNYEIGSKDIITLIPAIHGEDAKVNIEELVKRQEPFIIYINDKKIELPYTCTVNGVKVNHDYSIKNKDDIRLIGNYTIKDVMNLSEIKIVEDSIRVNNIPQSLDYIVNYRDRIDLKIERNNEETQVKPAECNKTLDFKVTVNGKEIYMNGKDQYIFVDVFDYIDFDLNNPKGKIVCLKNKSKVAYMEQLSYGDIIDIYWK